MEGDADGFRSEKMEGDRKFQRGNLSKVQNLSEDQNLSEVQISEVQNFRGKQKKEKTKGIFKKFVLITVGSEVAFFKNAA